MEFTMARASSMHMRPFGMPFHLAAVVYSEISYWIWSFVGLTGRVCCKMPLDDR